MSLDSRINNPSQYLPHDPKNIWSSDTNSKIREILDINEDDLDEQIIELISIIVPNAWLSFSREWWKVKKIFSVSSFIRLIHIWNNVLVVDMIQMPNQWIKAMLEVFSYAVRNDIKTLRWKVQPQKKYSQRRKKILLDFYVDFWFTSNDWGNISFEMNNDNKRVLRNKILYYLKNWRLHT